VAIGRQNLLGGGGWEGFELGEVSDLHSACLKDDNRNFRVDTNN